MKQIAGWMDRVISQPTDEVAEKVLAEVREVTAQVPGPGHLGLMAGRSNGDYDTAELAASFCQAVVRWRPWPACLAPRRAPRSSSSSTRPR